MSNWKPKIGEACEVYDPTRDQWVAANYIGTVPYLHARDSGCWMIRLPRERQRRSYIPEFVRPLQRKTNKTKK